LIFELSNSRLFQQDRLQLLHDDDADDDDGDMLMMSDDA